jgi:cytoskeletal protein RodZ
MRRGSTGILRRLSLLPVVLLMAIALVGPSTAFATSGSTYGAKPNTPTTPTTGTSPSKESSSPKKTPSPTSETSPTTTTTTPTTEAEKTGTLPFTGFDLRWSVGIGLLLMGAGFSIVVVQRRQRREH